jgi:hypothetical protein
MTRAEAHVAIWGGSKEQVDTVDWNMRHALVEAEDGITAEDYATMMTELDAMPLDRHPDPSVILAEQARDERS